MSPVSASSGPVLPRSIPGLTRPAPGSPTSAAARCASSGRTAAGTSRWPTRRGPRVSPTAWPSSSRPRRWAGSAGTGGRRTGPACWWPGSTRPRSRGGTSPTRRTRIARPPPWPIPRPGTPNAEVSLLLAGLDGRMVAVDTGGAAFPYLVTVSWDDRRPADRGAEPRPAGDAAARRGPGDRRDDGAARGHRPAVAGHRARGARPDRRRPTSDAERIAWVADAGGARRLLVGTPEELAGGATAAVTPPSHPGPRGPQRGRRRGAVHRLRG